MLRAFFGDFEPNQSLSQLAARFAVRILDTTRFTAKTVATSPAPKYVMVCNNGQSTLTEINNYVPVDHILKYTNGKTSISEAMSSGCEYMACLFRLNSTGKFSVWKRQLILANEPRVWHKTIPHV